MHIFGNIDKKLSDFNVVFIQVYFVITRSWEMSLGTLMFQTWNILMCAPSLRELLARLAVATDRMPWIQESVKLNENMKMYTGRFLPEWEELFAERNGKPLCLIC